MSKNCRNNFYKIIKYIFIGLITLSFYDNYVKCDRLILNSELAECYRKVNLKPLVPNTLQVLIEIIRKLENLTNSANDIRYLSAKLLHNIRVDGIQKDVNATESEFVIPYSPSGMMAEKFSVLLKLVSDVPGEFNYTEYLTQLEYCTLHRILSSTIEPIIRGDEHLTCHDKFDMLTNRVIEGANMRPIVISYQTTRCPVEGGVIRIKDYGTISPGILIASIAAGLQPQAIQLKEMFSYLEPSQRINNISEDLNTEYVDEKFDKQQRRMELLSTMNDRVNNTFASNLAGDLAEVCLFQSPYYGKNVHVGSIGYWNSIEYPKTYYLKDNNKFRWLMTDSEILSGIDGYYLANNIHRLTSQMTMRLSQVLELYYSIKGVPKFRIENSKRRSYSRDDFISSDSQLFFKSFGDGSTDSNSACRRKYILRNIERQKLKYETFLLAKLLQYTANTPFVEESVLKSACEAAVDQFFERAQKLIQSETVCKKTSKPKIDLILVLDGSRNQSENYKLVSQIGETMDVTSTSSNFSVVNGINGYYMIKSTQSIVQGFSEFKTFDKKHPHGLSLSTSLSSIIFSLQNLTSQQTQISGLSPVLVVISQSQKIRDIDFEDAKKLIEGSFKYNQNIYFIFITNDGPRFEALVADERKNPLNSKDKFKIIQTDNLDVNHIASELLKVIRNTPKWLRPVSNEFAEYEDYVGTEHTNHYRINSYELQQNGKFLVQFQVAETYGIIIVCKNIDSQPSECISSRNSISDEVWFQINDPCLDDNNCPAINFMVEMDTTNMRCNELTCRYPDDVRYTIRIKRSRGNSISLSRFSVWYLVLLSLISAGILIKSHC